MSESEASRRALAVDPGAAGIWRDLAYACFAPDPAAAASCFARTLALAPAPEAADWNNLAEALRVAGMPQAQAAGTPGAVRAARRALVLDPALPEAHNTRGNLLLQDHAEGRATRVAEMAGRVFSRALALRADFPRAAYNQAVAAAESGAVPQAIDLYDTLLRRHPDFIEARWNLALALLAAGRWREGWQAYEIRRADPRLAPRRFVAVDGERSQREIPGRAVPGWDGSPPAGRRLLLAAEQGFGDTIQFLRYVPQVVALGARVILDVPAPLLALARTIAGPEWLIATGDPVPAADLEAPLMSLPLLLGPERPPPSLPYLMADPARRALWRTRLGRPRLAGEAGRPKIGIAWAGNPAQSNDRRRSIADTDLAPLAALDGLRFVSLQKERSPPSAWYDAAPGLADFAETAALIAELDLVIAVDTAVAHLAGALGKPVWVLLSTAADWRWPRGGGRTPWYPSARQIWRRPGEAWQETLARLAPHLAAAFSFDPPGDHPPGDHPGDPGRARP